MNISILKNTLQQTLDGKINFPQVVGTLLNEGLESYHVDLVRSEYRYYNPKGETFVETIQSKIHNPNQDFSTDEVKAAIRASQAGQIKYKEFIDRILKAGCVYYIVYLAGKKVVYFGRNGESHTEHFPKAQN